LLSYGDWSFPARKYEFARAVYEITHVAADFILANDIDVVFIEDTQLRQNAQSFKKLAQLQGALINLFEGLGVSYENVPPTRWQSYCGTRGKAQSMQFVHSQFGIETNNDNLADAICIGHYAINQIKGREG
jgi:Holliday junction resolvasome RuvABC endonuclease subunit